MLRELFAAENNVNYKTLFEHCTVHLVYHLIEIISFEHHFRATKSVEDIPI